MRRRQGRTSLWHLRRPPLRLTARRACRSVAGLTSSAEKRCQPSVSPLKRAAASGAASWLALPSLLPPCLLVGLSAGSRATVTSVDAPLCGTRM